MANDFEENSPSMQALKTKLEQAFTRLERAIDIKTASTHKPKDREAELIAAQQEIANLRQKNKLASDRLDNSIYQIR